MIIATHNGEFHADDVFGVAMLTHMHPDAKIVRTRDDTELAKADIVLDVGGVYDPAKKRFDHHQLSSGARPNGIVYSAFGLLWREYGKEFCDGDEEAWKRIDDRLVQFIDAHDNGHDLFTLNSYGASLFDVSMVLDLYNPLVMSGDEEFDSQFEVVVKEAQKILLRLVAKIKDEVAGEEYFKAAYKKSDDKRYVVLDKYVPHNRIANAQPELLFVVYPHEATGNWAVQAVRTMPESFELRQAFPEAWRGLRGKELAHVTGVEDAVFCHKVGYIVFAKSRESAMKLLNIGLKG